MAFNDSLVNPGEPSIVAYHFLMVLGCGKHLENLLLTYL